MGKLIERIREWWRAMLERPCLRHRWETHRYTGDPSEPDEIITHCRVCGLEYPDHE